MPKIKKTATQKTTVKTPKRIPQKVRKQEDIAHKQTLVASLFHLENFWDKKNAALKKEFEALRSKHAKAAQKQKSAKGLKTGTAAKKRQYEMLAENTAILQAEILSLRQNIAHAKLAATKYSALISTLQEFEHAWIQKHGDEETLPLKAKKTKATAATKVKAPKADTKAKKEKTEKKEKVKKEKKEAKSLAAAPAKKRGRKPKAQVIDALIQEEIPLENLESMEDDSLILFIDQHADIDDMDDMDEDMDAFEEVEEEAFETFEDED